MAGNDNTVMVNLRRSVGIRLPGGGGAATLYGPGLVRVPRDVARSLGLKEERGNTRTRSVAPTDEQLKSAEGKQEETTANGSTATADPYKGWLKDDFVAEAERRQLEVKRTDGGDGDLRVEDYRAALTANDAEKSQ